MVVLVVVLVLDVCLESIIVHNPPTMPFSADSIEALEDDVDTTSPASSSSSVAVDVVVVVDDVFLVGTTISGCFLVGRTTKTWSFSSSKLDSLEAAVDSLVLLRFRLRLLRLLLFFLLSVVDTIGLATALGILLLAVVVITDEGGLVILLYLMLLLLLVEEFNKL